MDRLIKQVTVTDKEMMVSGFMSYDGFLIGTGMLNLKDNQYVVRINDLMGDAVHFQLWERPEEKESWLFKLANKMASIGKWMVGDGD